MPVSCGILVASANRVRVLLINSNRMKPAVAPVGLDYLDDALGSAGHDVQLLDLCFENEPLTALDSVARRDTPDVIGISIRNTDDCYLAGQAFFLPEVRDLIARLRGYSDAPIVVGGVGFSVAPARILQFCGADFGIAGEGERSFVQLLESMARPETLRRVPGLCYRDGESVRLNPLQPLDLAELPPRRRALVDNRRYFREGGQGGFETKRGCPMQCCYCADPIAKGASTRLMPPEHVVQELRALLGQGVDHLHTCDSEFNLPPDHALAVCEAITQAGLGDRIHWYAYCAPVPFDNDLAAACRRAGCSGINFGVDSGSDAMLARLGRNFCVTDIRSTAAVCRRHGIPFMFDLLMGGLGETIETISRTIALMRQINPDCVGLSMGVRLYPGTQLANQVRATGDLALNPAVRGVTADNADLLAPLFYVSPEIGRDITAVVRELVAGDARFFLPATDGANQGYNYNDNQVLVDAIANGARGAYWDILRRMRHPA